MNKVPTPIEVARAIAAGQCPVPNTDGIDWVLLGKACRGAISAGFVREYHGCFPDWGSYKVTDAGREAIHA